MMLDDLHCGGTSCCHEVHVQSVNPTMDHVHMGMYAPRAASMEAP